VKEKMTAEEVARIRARHQEGLRKGMTNAEASAYANEGRAPSAEEKVTRTRQRLYKALREGKSQEEANAYAKNPDLAEPSVPAPAEHESTAVSSAAERSGDSQSHVVGDGGSIATAAPLPPMCRHAPTTLA
jgi:hypothetical protein